MAKKKASTTLAGMAKKKALARPARPRHSKARSARYRGLYVEVTRPATTQAGKRLEEGDVLLAIGDPGADGWVPVLYYSRRDHVQRADVQRIVPKKIPKPSAAQQAARKRVVQNAGVKVSKKGAARIRAQWDG